MPELPEVDTIRRTLQDSIISKLIHNVKLSEKARIEHTSRNHLFEVLKGSQIKDIQRRGKYLLFILANQWILIIHLGMTGKLLFHVKQSPEQKHDHLIIEFSDHTFLVLNDARRFGKISLARQSEMHLHPLLNKLGAEYNDNRLKRILLEKLPKSKTIIKNVLLDQTIIAGIGNIYACEILFESKIHPNKASNSITLIEINRLFRAIKKILELAIRLGGSSIKDYIDGTGHKGSMQNYLKVYDRENKECINCKSIILRITDQGRSTWFCPKCQR